MFRIRLRWITFKQSWSPTYLRRILELRESQLQATQNGWSNMHLELVKLKEKQARCYNCSAWTQGEK